MVKQVLPADQGTLISHTHHTDTHTHRDTYRDEITVNVDMVKQVLPVGQGTLISHSSHIEILTETRSQSMLTW